MRRLVVWGVGELGGRVARLWLKDGGSVVGFTRTRRRHPDLLEQGVEARLGSPLGFLDRQDTLLLALPGHKTQ